MLKLFRVDFKIDVHGIETIASSEEVLLHEDDESIDEIIKCFRDIVGEDIDIVVSEITELTEENEISGELPTFEENSYIITYTMTTGRKWRNMDVWKGENYSFEVTANCKIVAENIAMDTFLLWNSYRNVPLEYKIVDCEGK